MRYAYHFEFCERPEMPEWLRGDLFQSLGFIQASFGLKQVLKEVVPELIRLSGAQSVIELGSGSGEGLALVAGGLPDFSMLATDKYPHPGIWVERLSGHSKVSWNPLPVGFDDFSKVLTSEQLVGSVLLLTSAFHHVPQTQAKEFLARACASRASVLVVEGLERSGVGALLGGLTAVPALAYPLRNLLIEPRKFWGWLRLAFFHWLVPVIPFCLMHDGVVSAFRQRTRPDWESMIQGLPYELEVRQKLGFLRNFSVVLLKHVG